MTHSEVTALITIDELLNENRPSEEDLKQIEDHMADWKERIDIIRSVYTQKVMLGRGV